MTALKHNSQKDRSCFQDKNALVFTAVQRGRFRGVISKKRRLIKLILLSPPMVHGVPFAQDALQFILTSLSCRKMRTHWYFKGGFNLQPDQVLRIAPVDNILPHRYDQSVLL
jgi:hypothetical protein